MSKLAEDLGAALETFSKAWCDADHDGVLALWDHDEPNPIYIAEEAAPLIGWDAIRAYFAGNRVVLKDVSVRTWDHDARPVSEGIALLFFQLHWNALLTDGSLMAGDVRVSALLRKTPGGWKFFHYVEAPLATMMQLRGFMRAQVDPVFAERREGHAT